MITFSVNRASKLLLAALVILVAACGSRQSPRAVVLESPGQSAVNLDRPPLWSIPKVKSSETQQLSKPGPYSTNPYPVQQPINPNLSQQATDTFLPVLVLSMSISDFSIVDMRVINAPNDNRFTFTVGSRFFTPGYGIHLEIIALGADADGPIRQRYVADIPSTSSGRLTVTASRRDTICPSRAWTPTCLNLDEVPETVTLGVEISVADLAGGYKRGHIERINLLKGNIRGLVLDAIVPKGDTSQAIFKSEYFPTMEWRAELPKRAGLFEITATLHRPLSS